MSRGKGMYLIEFIRREIDTSIWLIWYMINAVCRWVNIGFIYVGGIDISSVTYIGLFSLVIPITGIDK